MKQLVHRTQPEAEVEAQRLANQTDGPWRVWEAQATGGPGCGHPRAFFVKPADYVFPDCCGCREVHRVWPRRADVSA